MKPKRTYYDNDQLESEIWRNEAGKFHRLDGPAFREWHDNGQLWREAWCVNGQFHRLDGPAVQFWHDNGQLWREEWLVNGEYHRLDGPSYQEWSTDGRLYHEEWCINGVNYDTEAEFQVAVDLYKANEIAGLF